MKKNAPNPAKKAVAPALVYVGPDYERGLYVDKIVHMVRPRDFSEAEREGFLALRPDLAEWWAKEEGEEPIDQL